MKNSLSMGSLVGGTALEILSAAIIYAGIEAEDNMMILIGAAMFLIGFAIMKLRGDVRKADQEAEKKAQEDRITGYIDHFINHLLPDYIVDVEKEKLSEALYNLFGFEFEEEEPE